MSASRAVACDVLVRTEEGAYVNLALPAALRRTTLDARDRAFVTDLVYGAERERRALDYRLRPHVDRPLDELDPEVRAALRIGAYQLVHGTPAHAAVSATVDATPRRARGLVNAVLRRLAAEPPSLPTGDDIESVALRTSMPEWIARRLDTDLGGPAARAVMEAAATAPPLTLRTTHPDEVRSELEVAGASVEPGVLVPTALRVRGTGDPEAIPAVRDGRATPQDEASQAVIAIANAESGERVADVCAAPGGKAIALAEKGATVFASDRNAARVRTLARNAARVGRVLRCAVADARHPCWTGAFDVVLVDAPCSGLGVLARRPDARWRITQSDVAELAALQREILGAAACLVRPGGRLLYSVCTLTSAETIDIDRWAQRNLESFRAGPVPTGPWNSHGRGALLLPSAVGTDGMFVLHLQRSGPTLEGP